mmetsp:Transcript_6456/g.9005  ORF Transcript_6456/g.9005 Transcript_6456/m.9005 type:complete len:452 (-) Transcript_6456:108-1463(-)
MYNSFNFASFPDEGPLWRLEHVAMEDSSASAWVFCANHATDDQRSLNIFVNDMLNECVVLSKQRLPSYSTSAATVNKTFVFPPSIEQAVSPGPLNLRTLQWSLIQLGNLLSMASMIPDRVRKLLSNPIPSSTSLGEQYNISTYTDPSLRKTISRYFTLSNSETSRLLKLAQQRSIGTFNTQKYTLTHLLSAAVLTVTNALIQGALIPTESLSPSKPFRSLTQRFLLSVGLRSFGSRSFLSDFSSKDPAASAEDYTGGTVACAAGAVDFLVRMPSDTVNELRTFCHHQADGTAVLADSNKRLSSIFWAAAAKCRYEADLLIRKWQLVPESVRLFGFGMNSPVDILKSVEMDANSLTTLGRGFSCGVSNMGVAKFDGNGKKVSVRHVYYGTSQARNGVLCLLSCMSVVNNGNDGESSISSGLSGCLQFVSPLVSEEEADEVVTSLLCLLKFIE